jgi:hypothetical protein
MADTGRRAGVMTLLVAAVLFGCTFSARAQREKSEMPE